MKSVMLCDSTLYTDNRQTPFAHRCKIKAKLAAKRPALERGAEKKQERAGPSRALSLSLSSCFLFEVPCLDMKIGTSFKILETDSLTEVDLATPSKPVQKSMLLLDALYRRRSHFGTPFAAPHNRNIRAFS